MAVVYAHKAMQRWKKEADREPRGPRKGKAANLVIHGATTSLEVQPASLATCVASATKPDCNWLNPPKMPRPSMEGAHLDRS